ncbi:SusC/RagA family TonB-linked outer membrane protein [Lutimonas sp.]|uniref:SusC/RagA family TonB-linked outer membrane protein n=1 Tax=Lutimonas sp. TaxID=1872403 RepID=UPI003D9B0261
MKFNLLKQLVFASIFLFAGIAYSQTVSGTVTGDEGPLPGVNVIVKGTSNGASTDFDGNYSLDNLSGDAVLEFSSLGFVTQEVTVNGQTTINVVMETDSEALDEVIVIGYGTTTVKDATGAVASVSSDDFNGGAIASAEQLIQGKVAGVQTVQSSGEPGAGIAIRIRGTNSIRSNNDPLYVVDGVPLTGAAPPEGPNVGFGSSVSSNPLSFLNPNDIESMSVLKDASATAIYGSRGANGVVIITTKSGKGRQGGQFEFNTGLSYSTPANSYDLLNAEDFLDAVEQFGGNPDDQDFGSETDWQDVVTRDSFSHDTSLSYNYNYSSGSIRGTLGYQDLQGVLKNSGLQRSSGRINWFQRLFDDKLNLSIQSTLSQVNEEQPALSGSAGFRGDLLGAAYSANPTWANDPDIDTGGQINPANMLAYTQSLTETDRVLINFSADYAFLPGLVGKLTLGYDKSNSLRESNTSPASRNLDRGSQDNGLGAFSDAEASSKLMELTLTWDKDWENSRLNLLGGYSYQDFVQKGNTAQGWGYNTSNMNDMARALRTSVSAVEQLLAGSSYQQFGIADPNGNSFVNRLFPEPSSEPIAGFADTSVRSFWSDYYDYTDELQSFFTRANYTIRDKYLFTATVRIDGSSRFGSDNQYGVFPSAAFAWKVNEEDFIGDNVSTLKARLSWGITGNQEGLGHGNFIRRERFAGPGIADNGEINTPGTSAVAFANPDLKWEETTSYGFGIDFGLAADRLTTTFDIYYSETNDLLLRIEAAQPSPQPFFFQNLDAIVINQGVEFSINYDFFDTEDFSWDAGFNISYNENEIKDFAGQIPAGTIRGQGLSGAYAQILAQDQPLFSYFLREFEGFDENGQPIGDDQTFVGKSALPTTNYGLNTNLRYKNWDLNMFFTGQAGGYVYNNTANAFFTAGAIANARNVTPDVLVSGEAGNAEAAVSTRFLEKADFFRFQNMTLGYDFMLSDTSAIDKLRLSLTGQNLFIITDYTGLDPELSTNPGSGDLLNNLPTAGIDYTSYPRPRVFTLGINLVF